MSDLKYLFAIQARQQAALYDKGAILPEARQRIADDLNLGLSQAAAKLARCCRHPLHVTSPPQVNRHNLIGEMADVVKYALAIADLHDVTVEELTHGVINKTTVIEQQWLAERMERTERTLVFVTDLDGCVADIAPFIQQFGGYGESPPNGWDRLQQERAKADWYASGGFLGLPAIQGASAALHIIRDHGVKIVVVTARPYWEHTRIYQDTVQWLNANDIPFDLIDFAKDKWDSLVQRVLPSHVIGFVEDRDKHCAELIAHGVPVLLMDQPWNRGEMGSALEREARRVHNWSEVLAEALKRIDALQRMTV